MSLEVLRLIKVRAQFEPIVRQQLMKHPLKFLQRYDLTENEKQQIVLPHFDWLVEKKLAALSYPESQDALTILWKFGIRALLNVAEAPLPEEMLKGTDLLIEHIPIEGFTAPTLRQVELALSMIDSCLDRNMPVAVHCVAGLGRTGTILACYLVGQGVSADKAIHALREWRPGSIETSEQENIVHEYERFLHVQQ